MTENQDENIKILKEGTTQFYLYSDDINNIPSKSMNVFYNKKMEINRDVTSLAINAYNNLYNLEELTIVDTMAGSGVGSIRILKECSNIKIIYINDLNPSAVKIIHKNLEINGLLNLKNKIIVSRYDANFLLSSLIQQFLTSKPSKRKKPNVISVDPFGTPNIYVDSVFKAIQKREGLVCITATDTAVLFGVRKKACERKYMSKPLHNNFCKEIGARILLYFISRIASINNVGIKPLFTFYHQHFIRIIALTFKNKNDINKQIENYGYIFFCKKCGHRIGNNCLNVKILQDCTNCGATNSLDYAGPLWLDELHQQAFLDEILRLTVKSNYKNKKKLEKILMFCKDEMDMPISYYNIHKLCHQIKCASIPKMETLIKTIKNDGYSASRTHFDFTSLKTDLDIDGLKQILLNLTQG
ncbi:MAG: tRNA (guanine(10)-N(2))-dimethyltransferase [Candidatus Lokiarchaeota archaeon]|nr:tRNA (guanine(10)-N(2))-dimethyltransferase [Candidatus Lokiarchaeota archaeon]MBD3200974.1 tRNA (guanine(10)-N(2))-dimethyltransferase [Candidatus Lokiarchaeota archaeon]